MRREQVTKPGDIAGQRSSHEMTIPQHMSTRRGVFHVVWDMVGKLSALGHPPPYSYAKARYWPSHRLRASDSVRTTIWWFQRFFPTWLTSRTCSLGLS